MSFIKLVKKIKYASSDDKEDKLNELDSLLHQQQRIKLSLADILTENVGVFTSPKRVRGILDECSELGYRNSIRDKYKLYKLDLSKLQKSNPKYLKTSKKMVELKSENEYADTDYEKLSDLQLKTIKYSELMNKHIKIKKDIRSL